MLKNRGTSRPLWLQSKWTIHCVIYFCKSQNHEYTSLKKCFPSIITITILRLFPVDRSGDHAHPTILHMESKNNWEQWRHQQAEHHVFTKVDNNCFRTFYFVHIYIAGSYLLNDIFAWYVKAPTNLHDCCINNKGNTSDEKRQNEYRNVAKKLKFSEVYASGISNSAKYNACHHQKLRYC